MSTDKIISRKNGPIGHLVFNNPGKRKNAATERVVAACFASQDYVEGRRAFMDKRKPAFRGA